MRRFLQVPQPKCELRCFLREFFFRRDSSSGGERARMGGVVSSSSRLRWGGRGFLSAELKTSIVTRGKCVDEVVATTWLRQTAVKRCIIGTDEFGGKNQFATIDGFGNGPRWFFGNRSSGYGWVDTLSRKYSRRNRFSDTTEERVDGGWKRGVAYGRWKLSPRWKRNSIKSRTRWSACATPPMGVCGIRMIHRTAGQVQVRV